MIPAMIDQYLYLTDIESIGDDLSILFKDSKYYASNNTLYARIVGAFGKLFCISGLAPIIPAVLLNTVFHTLLSFFTIKYYKIIGGEKTILLFFFIYMMPSMFAYTLFALRDTMILLFFTMFVLQIIVKQYKKAGFSTMVLFLLRPLYLSYTAYVVFLVRMWRVEVKRKKKIFFVTISTISAIGVAFLLINFLNLQWMFDVFSKESFTAEQFFMSTVGLGLFSGELTTETVLSASGSKTVRYLMFDSLFVPTLALFSACYLLRKGDNKNKRLLGFLLIFLMISLSFSYMAIQGNYPFRKLLPLVPLQYVVCFLAFEQWLFNFNRSKQSRLPNDYN